MLVTITRVTQDFTKSGAEYLKVKGVTGDGKETTKSVFDNLKDKWPLLKEHATLDFKMEKKGQFWNVTNITPAGEVIKSTPSEPTPAGVQKAYETAKKELDTMSKDDWDARDKRTRKSIERQTAGNLGVKCVELSGVKEGITKKAITSAKDWEKYFETGE